MKILIRTIIAVGFIISATSCKRGTYQYGNNESKPQVEYTQAPNANPLQPPK